MDADGNGQIEFSEFLAHSLTLDHLTKENVRILFDDIIRTFVIQSKYDKMQKAQQKKLAQKRKGQDVENGN